MMQWPITVGAEGQDFTNGKASTNRTGITARKRSVKNAMGSMYGAPSFEPTKPVDHNKTKIAGAALARNFNSASMGRPCAADRNEAEGSHGNHHVNSKSAFMANHLLIA